MKVHNFFSPLCNQAYVLFTKYCTFLTPKASEESKYLQGLCQWRELCYKQVLL